MTIHPAQHQPALRPVAHRASAAVEERPTQSTAPSESVELSSRETSAKPSIAPENLRPGDQHEAGLKGALNAVGGFLGVAMTKAMRGMKGPMMTGAWKDLLVASYEVPKEALQPYLPEGVELDSWNGKHYMSLVALQCQDIQGLCWLSPRRVDEITHNGVKSGKIRLIRGSGNTEPQRKNQDEHFFHNRQPLLIPWYAPLVPVQHIRNWKVMQRYKFLIEKTQLR